MPEGFRYLPDFFRAAIDGAHSLQRVRTALMLVVR
jgi:hypothetical protein